MVRSFPGRITEHDFTHAKDDGTRRMTRKAYATYVAYVTHSSEYHIRYPDHVCVAVRNRQTDSFITKHDALGSRLEGGSDEGGGWVVTELIKEGHCLEFGPRADQKRGTRTTPLEEIKDAPKNVVALYPPLKTT